MENLFSLLNAIAILSPELEAHLRSILHENRFKFDEVILRAGEICDNIYFLEAGLIRIYEWNENKEVTTWLLKEGDIFISIKSFFERTPSHEYIQALENCVTWGITYSQLEETCRKFPEFYIHRDIIKTKYYLISNQRQADILTLSPEKRYEKLMIDHPEIRSRVPIKYLYSYLGISQSTLARIRRT